MKKQTPRRRRKQPEGIHTCIAVWGGPVTREPGFPDDCPKCGLTEDERELKRQQTAEWMRKRDEAVEARNARLLAECDDGFGEVLEVLEVEQLDMFGGA